MVLQAPSLPTIWALLSRESVVYFTRDGVTVPSRNKGKTNMIMQERNAAQVRNPVLIVIARAPAMATIRYFPAKGMAAIHRAAMSILK